MTTEAQIAANRKNALNSTGPRTAAGKRITRMNSLKHGQTARTMCLPNENADELQAFLNHWADALASTRRQPRLRRLRRTRRARVAVALQVRKIDEHITRALIPPRGLLFKRLPDDALQLGRAL